jgi:hypothetical protein
MVSLRFSASIIAGLRDTVMLTLPVRVGKNIEDAPAQAQLPEGGT